MLRQVLLWMLLLIFFLCCSSQGQIFDVTKLEAMSTTKDTEERAYMSHMYALFQIVDPKYSEKILENASDYFLFRDRVEDWIRQNSGRWNEINNRLNYCKDLMQKGQLGTDIDNANPDVRWRLFIENGAPQDDLTLLGRYTQNDTACTVWLFIWPSASSDRRALEIACWSRLDQNYPVGIIPRDDKGFSLAFPIWPFVNYSKFSSSDGTTDLWFSVWVPCDQFTSLTLDEGQLSIQIDLYDSSKTILVASGKEISSLQIIRGILKSAESQDRRFIRAMGYIGFSKIKPGKYSARLTLLGASYNEGQNWIEVLIPEKKETSDLLILGHSMATGESVLSGIVRGEQENLYDNPECLFISGAKFDLYLETTFPNGHGKYFAIWVTLLRIPEISDRKSGSVTSGKFIVVADSLGRPFTNGEWKSSQNQKLLEDLAAADSHSKSSKIITLFRKKFDAIEGEVIPIEVPVHLESDLRSGRYLLTVTISDPDRQSYFLSARRVIRVVPSSSIAW